MSVHIDTNEILGFVHHCRNADYLFHLRNEIDARIRQLGGPTPVQMHPNRHDARAHARPHVHPDGWNPGGQGGAPAHQVSPETVGNPVEARAETANVFDRLQREGIKAVSERRHVVGGVIYSIAELVKDDVRLGYGVRNLKNQHAYLIHTEGGSLACDCPDFVHRHAGQGGECKHIAAVREVYPQAAALATAEVETPAALAPVLATEPSVEPTPAATDAPAPESPSVAPVAATETAAPEGE